MENKPSTAEISAGQVMSSPAIACREETRLEEIAEVLGEHRISGLAVVDANDRLVGMVSERDIAHALGGPLMRLAVRRPAREGDTDRRFVMEGARLARDVMSSPAISADPDATLQSLAQVMYDNQVNRIPILVDDHLVGMVTRGDLLKGVGGFDLQQPSLDDHPIIVGSGIEGGSVTRLDK